MFPIKNFFDIYNTRLKLLIKKEVTIYTAPHFLTIYLTSPKIWKSWSRWTKVFWDKIILFKHHVTFDLLAKIYVVLRSNVIFIFPDRFV